MKKVKSRKRDGKNMKAAVVRGKCQVVIEETEEPQITKPSEIKIHVTKGAICNTTDNMIYATDHPEDFWPGEKFPFIIGHECTGRIVELGSDVKEMKIGDRVVYWTVCGRAFADYLILDTEEFAVGTIGENVSDDIAAMMEMVIGAGRQLFKEDGSALIKQGDKVVVYGLGPAGLIYHRLAIMLGASKVCGVGRRELRLSKSLEVGASFSVNSEKTGYIEEIIEKMEGRPDVIIDATGGDIIENIIALGDEGTQVVAYGIPPFDWNEKIPLLEKAGLKAPIFTGTESARISLKHCVKWAESGGFGLEPIITHRIKLRDLGKGLDMCRLQRDTTLKVIVTINEED